MTPSSSISLRLLHLLRRRYKFIIVVSIASACFGLTLGMMTPYVFSSSATVEIQIKGGGSSVLQRLGVVAQTDYFELLRASSIILSPIFLIKVAEKVHREKFPLSALFPKQFSALDLKFRLGLLLQNIGLKSPEKSDTEFNTEIGASLLARHLSVETDVRTHTVTVTCEAGAPNVAQKVCQFVTDHFIEVSNILARAEFLRQEAYLESTIEKHTLAISETEMSLQRLLKKSPYLALGMDEKGGKITATIAKQNTDTRERLKQIDEELAANAQMLEMISRDLSSSNQIPESNNSDDELAKNLHNEIKSLELQRLHYINVLGYPKTRRELVDLTRRIETLKRALSQLKPKTVNNELRKLRVTNQLDATHQINELKAKTRRLRIERDNLARHIATKETSVDEAVKSDFEISSMQRQLSSQVGILSELYRELQKTRLVLAGMEPSAKILSPASFNTFATNWSTNKRTFFGFLVGLFLGAALLQLFDLLDPRLFSEDDLATLQIKPLGVYRRDNHLVDYAASAVMSLRMRRPSESGTVLAYLPNAVPNFEKYVEGIARRQVKYGTKVGLIILDSPETNDNLFAVNGQQKDMQVVWLRPEEIPYFLPSLIAEMRSKLEWIFIVPTSNSTLPVESLITPYVDFFLYFSELGHSKMRVIRRMRQMTESNNRAEHCGLIIDAAA